MEIVGVTEGVLKHIRVNIITRAIPPGHKINEAVLSSSLGISRAPLREALRILENENLVVSFPRKGCCVTSMSIKDCYDIFGSRTMMECYAIDMMEAQKIRRLPNVELALEKMAELTKPDEDNPYEKYDYLRAIADFHIKIIEAPGNRRTMQLYNVIFPSLARYQSLYTYIPGLMDQSEHEHRHTLELIQAGKYSEAKAALSSHINKFVLLIEDKVREIERDAPSEPCGVLMAG